MTSHQSSGQHLNIDHLITADHKVPLDHGKTEAEWRSPVHGHQQSLTFAPKFASGEYNPKVGDSQIFERDGNHLTEPSRNISITENNASLSGWQEQPQVYTKQQPDLKKLQLKAARLLMGQNASKVHQERISRLNYNQLNNSVDLPSSSFNIHGLNAKMNQEQRNHFGNLQLVDNHASVNLLQQKPSRRMHSNFQIPSHPKSNQGGSLGASMEGSIVNHQSYDRIDHRSLNQFQLFNLRSSKNSKDAPGNIYMVNTNQ